MEIITLIKSNIKNKKGAFKSIIVLMLILMAIVGSIISLSDNIEKSLNSSLDKSNASDMIAFVNKSNLTDDIQSKLDKSESFEFTQNESIYTNNVRIKGDRITKSVGFLPWENNYPVFNDKLTAHSNPPEPLNNGEVYIPVTSKDSFNCDVGDEIVLPMEKGDETFTIKGFVEEPYIGAMVIGIKFYFMSQGDYDRIYKSIPNSVEDEEKAVSKVVRVNINQKEDTKLSNIELKKILNKETSLVDFSMLSLTKRDAIGYTLTFTDIGSSICYAFAIILFFITIIVIGHSISTTVESDFSSLGILKALGFTASKIRAVYLIQNLLAMLIGAVLGIIISIPLTKILGGFFLPITGILAPASISVLPILLVLVLVLVIGGLFLLISTRKIVKISPVKAISGENNNRALKTRVSFPINKRWLKTTLALRQFTSKKRRYIGTIAITSILVFFMSSMVFLSDSLSSGDLSESFGGINADAGASVSLEDGNEIMEEMKSELNNISPVVSSVFAFNDYYSFDDADLNSIVYDDVNSYKNILKGKAPVNDNEILITEIVADEFNKKIGDTVTISNKGKSAEFVISGYFQYTNDVGRCIGMTFAGVERISKIESTGFYFTLEDKEKTNEAIDMLNEKYIGRVKAGTIDSSGKIMDTIMLAINSVTFSIFIVSVLLVLVIVSMTGRKLFLQERQDFGIYKAVGFVTKNLRLQFALRFLAVAIIGSAVGVGLIFAFSQKLLSIIFRAAGVTKFAIDYSIMNIGLPILLICICYFLFAYISSRIIRIVSARELIVE